MLGMVMSSLYGQLTQEGMYHALIDVQDVH